MGSRSYISRQECSVSMPPMSRFEMEQLGWDECDCIIVTGDAYVDHPAFGSAVIARVLLNAGFRVGVIAQPDWKSTTDFQRLGRPRLFFGVTAGNVDSMVNHYSPLGQRRKSDAYSPAGIAGLRPNRATIVYSGRLREAFAGVRIVLGGVEASLRRLAHYDYWDNAVRRAILLDAKADIIAYGMAERAIREIAGRLANNAEDDLDGIAGTVTVRDRAPDSAIVLPSYEEVRDDKKKFLQAFKLWYEESDQPKGRAVVQAFSGRYVVQYPMAMPMSPAELDAVYDLPYQRQAHPCYRAPIPALATVKFSITSHRGCLGQCTFCSLTAHQGRVVQWRSEASIIREAERIAALPDFKGHITDIGGPTANMYGATCAKLAKAEPCRQRECLYPQKCPNLKTDFPRQLRILEAVRKVKGVKKVSLGTGLRYDLLESDDELEKLCRHYVSGQLRVAPEHCVDSVLRLMRKTSLGSYEKFARRFQAVNRRLGRKQYLIPYFISGFPGCTVEDMLMLARENKRLARAGLVPHCIRQVQDFTPTPMTAATTMYYTGIDPFTGRELYVARDIQEKKLQRALLQADVPENKAYIRKHLKRKP